MPLSKFSTFIQYGNIMTQDELKQKVAHAAIEYVKDVAIIGVGTGSTVKHFIDYLADIKGSIEGAVSSSEVSTAHLKKVGIPVFDLNAVGTLDVYVDGADEVNPHKHMIKGGGGALTREKIIAAASKKFVCIVDETKTVDVLGAFALPVEVIPMARTALLNLLMTAAIALTLYGTVSRGIWPEFTTWLGWVALREKEKTQDSIR